MNYLKNEMFWNREVSHEEISYVEADKYINKQYKLYKNTLKDLQYTLHNIVWCGLDFNPRRKKSGIISTNTENSI